MLKLITDGDTVDDVYMNLWAFSSTEPFNDWSKALARTFVTNTFEENARTWRQAAEMSGQGDMIRRALQRELDGSVEYRVRELIDSNALYIKSVPQDIAQRLVTISPIGRRAAVASDVTPDDLITQGVWFQKKNPRETYGVVDELGFFVWPMSLAKAYIAPGHFDPIKKQEYE